MANLGCPRTGTMCWTLHYRLPMDRTTSRLLHSRFAGCPRPLGGIPGIGTRKRPTGRGRRRGLILTFTRRHAEVTNVDPHAECLHESQPSSKAGTAELKLVEAVEPSIWVPRESRCIRHIRRTRCQSTGKCLWPPQSGDTIYSGTIFGFGSLRAP